MRIIDIQRGKMPKKKPNNVGIPELFFGLVGAVGTDLDLVCTTLRESLKAFEYECETIKLSEILREISHKSWKDLIFAPEEDRIHSHMDRGDSLRAKTKRGDALALLSVGAIQEYRKRKEGKEQYPLINQAYIFKSLKHPDEVRALRKIYCNNFFLISVYTSPDKRIESLTSKIASSHNMSRSKNFKAKAEEIIARDEAEENNQYGQNVRETFPLADVFIDSSDIVNTRNSLNRFISLLFNNPELTPTPQEYAMVHAKFSSLRSASYTRQVGAVIANQWGDIITMGTNEIPKPGGGLYWTDDNPDGRDISKRYDSSDKMRRNILAEILDKLSKSNLVLINKSKNVKDLVDELLYEGDPPLLKNAQFMDIIEYGRSVHAEMAAICDAARLGISTKGCSLYCTTFPCHECARLIVAAGINKVYYIEPYPKSLVLEMYSDSISIEFQGDLYKKVNFIPFVGIAPRIYFQFFIDEGKRIKYRGEFRGWIKTPVHANTHPIIIGMNEHSEMTTFKGILDKNDIILQRGG